MCAAYTPPVPSECDTLLTPHKVLGAQGGEGDLSTYDFVKLLCLFVASVGVVLYCFKRIFFQRFIHKALREEVMLEVQSQLADYVPLDETREGTLPGVGGMGVH